MDITPQAKKLLLNQVIIDVNDSGMVILGNNTMFYLDEEKIKDLNNLAIQTS